MNLLHADYLLQLRELKTAERLGEDVRELPTSFDEIDDDLPSINTVPEKVELDVNVLAPVVENRILREGHGGLVVHHQCWWVSFRTGQLAQQLWQNLLNYRAHMNLSLSNDL